MDAEESALQRIMGDMDEMESSRVFGKKPTEMNKGVDITISVIPNTGEPESEELPKGYDVGGLVGAGVDEDKTLPPFLRKKKGS